MFTRWRGTGRLQASLGKHGAPEAHPSVAWGLGRKGPAMAFQVVMGHHCLTPSPRPSALGPVATMGEAEAAGRLWGAAAS